MKRLPPKAALAALLTAAGLTGVSATAHASPKPQVEDIASKLKAIKGVTLTKDTILPQLPDERYYELTYKQPVDHRHPKKGYFEQRIRILHKSMNRPVVLFVTGYDLYTTPYFRSEPTTLLDGDQVSIEQRFFTPSRPSPANWSDLNIWQAATDQHLIVQALKKVYKHNRWIENGASKGGMTTIYARRFYPHDLNGSVAYVAPNNTDVWNNKPYDHFFNTVGTASCRAKLNGLQQEALNRRGEIDKMIAAEGAAQNPPAHWTVVRTVDRDFEATVVDFRWAFWQYHLASECSTIPARTASTQTIFNWIDSVDSWVGDDDESLAEFIPYYYQAATQLGEPNPSSAYLRGLRYGPNIDTSRTFIPRSIHVPPFDYRAMPDIDHWVKTRGSQLMFLYGGNDPWGVKAFHLGKGSKDSYWYSVAGQNHSEFLISKLPPAQQKQAIAALFRWAGLKPPSNLSALAERLPQQDPLLTYQPKL